MMGAREAVTPDVGEDAPHDAAQGLLHHEIVADQISGHSRSVAKIPGKANAADQRVEAGNEEVEASVARRLRAPPYGATRKDLF